MKKVYLFIFCLSFLSHLAPVPTQAQTILKMVFNAPPAYIGPIADRYAEVVAQKSENQIQIKWFGGGQLGSNIQNYAQIKTGQIDMMLIGSNLLGISKGGMDFEISVLPFVFRDQDHFRKYFSSPLFTSMVEKAEREGGFKYIGFLGDRAPRQLTSNRRVAKIEDLKGFKIRSPEVKSIVEVWKVWGAEPVSISASELYVALKQGVVDGQDNGFDAIAMAKYYEVQKYVTVIDYIRWGLVVLINAEQWNRLNPVQKKVFEEAALETDRFGTKTSNDSVAQSIDVLKKHGMEIIYPDLGPFKKLALKVKEKFDGDLWEKGLYEKIQAIR